MAVDRPTCTPVDSPPSPLSIRLPGGIVLQSMPLSSEIVATELSYVQAMMAQLAPFLGMAYPFFIAVDTLIALKDTVVAIPGLIGGDVPTFRDAKDRVLDGVAKLTGMAPAASVPLLIRDLVAFLVVALSVIEAQLDEIIEMEAEAQQALDDAATAPEAYAADLQIQGECIQAQAAAMLEHAVAAVGPVQGLLTIIGVLSQLVQGIPGMPEAGDLSGSAEEVKIAISTLREALSILPV